MQINELISFHYEFIKNFIDFLKFQDLYTIRILLIFLNFILT